jgi:RNA-binding protein Nova
MSSPLAPFAWTVAPSLGEDLNAKRLAFHAGPCWFKVLVADKVAGSIIGKAGRVITDIEKRCGCIMKLSPGNSFFPGTQERIIVVSGLADAISEAVGFILEKTHSFMTSEYRADEETTRDIDISIRAVVPNSAVSCIIGRGGEVHKEISRISGAVIRIGDRLNIVHERIVQVTGTIDQCNSALLEILTRIQSDKNLKEHLNVVYTKASMQSERNANRTNESIHRSPPMCNTEVSGFHVQTPSGSVPMNTFNEASSNMYAQPCSISLNLAPGVVSSILLRRIESQTGASLRFRPSSNTVQINGAFGAVHTAHILLLKETADLNTGLYTPPHESMTSTPSPTARHSHEI